ncbi:hypothetical protein, partial [Caldisericum sp.]|uniref:hypothetical protein n=1 Tax=Caldisericum sp. TaxID=2499687 RepID=UPI003D1057FF
EAEGEESPQFGGVLRGGVAPSKWLSYRAKRDISSVYIGGSKSPPSNFPKRRRFLHYSKGINPPSNYPQRRRFLLTTFVEMTGCVIPKALA